MAKPKFKNAAKGLGQVFGAQLLAILAGIVMGIAGGTRISVEAMDWHVWVYLIGAIIFAIALIVEMVGLHNAGKDNKQFGHAFSCALVSLIVVLVSAILRMAWPIVFNDFVMGGANVIVGIFTLLSFYFTISGGRELLAKRGEKGTERLGAFVWNCILIALVLVIIAAVLILIPGVATSAIALAILVVGGLAEFIGDICFIVFVGKAKNRLD